MDTIRCAEVDSKDITFTVPFVVSDCKTVAAYQKTKLGAMVDFTRVPFFKDPKIDPAKGGTARGQQQPKNEAMRSEIVSCLARVVGKKSGHLIRPGDVAGLLEGSRGSLGEARDFDAATVASLTGALDGSLFGICKATLHSGVQKFQLGTFMYNTMGTRKIFAVMLRDVEEHLKSLSIEPADKRSCYSATQVKNFLMAGTKEEIGLFVRKFSCWVVSVGPDELLHLPAGCNLACPIGVVRLRGPVQNFTSSQLRSSRCVILAALSFLTTVHHRFSMALVVELCPGSEKPCLRSS